MASILTLILIISLYSYKAIAGDFICQYSDNDVHHIPDSDVEIQNENKLFDHLKPIQIPITYDLAQKLNIDTDQNFETVLGNVVIYNDGQILYDGKDISSNVKGYCNHDGASSKDPIITQSE
jgi:hypothetical protein